MNDRQPPTIEQIKPFLKSGSFEETLAALELVVEHLERGRLSLSDAVDWYEAGLGLSSRCSDLLQHAELRVIDLERHYGVAGNVGELWDEDER